MKASALDIVSSLEKALIQFPQLVNKLKGKEADFVIELEKWIIELESVLTRNNIAKVSELAGLRSKILAPTFSITNRNNIRKTQLQIAAETLYDIQKSVSNILLPYETKINEARDIVVQLLMILSQSEVLKFANIDFQNFVIQLWSTLSNTEQLKPSIAKILTLVSYNDALRLISEEVNLEYFK